jgi:Raf kinase inhibitor-like YbhB/YbcL family protein
MIRYYRARNRHAYLPKKQFPVMYKRRIFQVSLIAIFMIIVCGCVSPPSPSTSAPAQAVTTPSPPASTLVASGVLTLKVGNLAPGSVLPDINTCKGAGESPGVSWDGIPAGTKSLVLILDDPDAPAGTFTHWIVYNIPPQKGSLTPAQHNTKVLENDAQQGDTSVGSRGYYPPCPPIGTSHHYVFHLYAVDMDITQPTADRESIDWAMTGHTIAKTEITTMFKR